VAVKARGKQYERLRWIDGAVERPTPETLKRLEHERAAIRDELLREVNPKEPAFESPGGQRLSGPQERVVDFAPRWLEHMARLGKIRAHVAKARRDHLNTFILPFLGERRIALLKRSDVVAWFEYASTLRQSNGTLYNRITLHGAWATLRAMLKRAVVLRDLDKDPTAGIRFDIGIHVAGEQRPERPPKSTLTIDELGRVLEAAKGESPDMRAMIVLQVATGLRFCELSALEWQDIELDEGRLHIRRSQVDGNIGPPKTERTRRTVYLPPPVVELLREHQRWQIDNQVAGLKAGLLFPSSNGKYRFTSVLTKPLARACKIAGVDKHLTSHCLRKTANNLIRLANGDTVARAMIGHASDEMTQLYSDVDQTERARAHAAAFGDALERTSSIAPAAADSGDETLLN
jgi:integrase